ncbi:MAG: rod shape-determining protein MreC [Ignavibacteriales bacterium]|nr:rod shape-determining protein MreC [Ignavibacteriales bacterium]
MLKFLRRLAADYKEYILVIALSVISLTLLSKSEKPQAKHLKTFALGNFAILSEITNSLTSIFKRDVSLDELKMENAQLMLEVNRMRKLRTENEELRNMIAFRDTSSYPLIPAKVISKLVTKSQGNFIINRGSNDEIKKGMPVLSEKGLIGLIMDVAENFSVVRTLNNSNLNIAVTLQRTNVDGILSYDGMNLVIKDIPTTYDVQIGDRVETSDFSTLFPPSIPIGIVEKKESNVLGLLHIITITPFADIPAENDLFILKVLPSKQINNLEMNLLKQN